MAIGDELFRIGYNIKSPFSNNSVNSHESWRSFTHQFNYINGIARPPKALMKRTPSLLGESPTPGKGPTFL